MDLCRYLRTLSPYVYALTKTDVPYMPIDFPHTYPIGKDLDIFVSSSAYQDIVSETMAFAQQYLSDTMQLRTITDNVGTRLRLEQSGKLHYQFDIRIDMNGMLSNRVWCPKGYYTLAMSDEITIRRNEVALHPHKCHHVEWLRLNASKNSLD